jgi:hypothetical protein
MDGLGLQHNRLLPQDCPHIVCRRFCGRVRLARWLVGQCDPLSPRLGHKLAGIVDPAAESLAFRVPAKGTRERGADARERRL